MGSEPATNDLCDGLSPCDAYPNYWHGKVGESGFCFLPPTVDNHLSDPACSGAFVPGLDGAYKLAWCHVGNSAAYVADNGTTAPTIDYCQKRSEWQDLVQDPSGGEFYVASVQWKKNDKEYSYSFDDVFRLYVVHEVPGQDLRYAHRDVILDPNLKPPADAFVHAIGYGTEPVKVRITRDVECVPYDTQTSGTDNAAFCLIDGETDVPLYSVNQDNGLAYDINFHFPDGNQPFTGTFEVSECQSLSDAAGNALVDTPLADCQVSLSSDQIQELAVPGQIEITLADPRWLSGGVFGEARLNVLQADGAGVAALPPATAPSWFQDLTASNSVGLQWIGKGLDKLASLLLPKSLYAQTAPGGTLWDFTRMSRFQVSVQNLLDFDPAQQGSDCATPSLSCKDLGNFPAGESVPVGVKVSAPTRTSPTTYFAVPGTRLHFFKWSGTVSCPTPPATDGGVCIDPSTDPYPSTWGDLVYITGSDGAAPVVWTPGPGDDSLEVSGCGVARPGYNKPPPPLPGDPNVYGSLGDCSNRLAAINDQDAFDNGPAPGPLAPFEPIDITNEVAIYGLPLTFKAHTCPTITINGYMGVEADGTSEWACAQVDSFSAPLSGPKGAINAWLYTYNDNDAVYVGLKVHTDNLGSKIFLNFVENTLDQQADGDELLVKDFTTTDSLDWHFTDACLGNNSSSLCGDRDTQPDTPADTVQAAAQTDGAGSGYVFYEFKRPLTGTHNTEPGKEDLAAAPGDTIGVRVTVTQGKGGGKGGFVYPDPQTSPVEFHLFTIH